MRIYQQPRVDFYLGINYFFIQTLIFFIFILYFSGTDDDKTLTSTPNSITSIPISLQSSNLINEPGDLNSMVLI